MIRSRVRKIAIVAGAGAVATASVLALSPFSASAADPTPTTVVVTAPATITTGHAVTFTAAVSPFKTTSAPVVKAGGTVSFTITGSDASTVSCTGGNSALLLNGKGKAVCKVATGGLLASASPYTVSAIYTGDPNFSGNSGVLSQTVSRATTHVKLTFDAKPVSGATTTFTATVTGGSGSMPTGTVLFSASSPGAQAAKLKCNPGGNSQPLAANSASVPVAQATCVLAANWFKVPAPTKTSPHPSNSWSVWASYSGDGNFGVSVASNQGSSKV
jgi:hypothetical protein